MPVVLQITMRISNITLQRLACSGARLPPQLAAAPWQRKYPGVVHALDHAVDEAIVLAVRGAVPDGEINVEHCLHLLGRMEAKQGGRE